MAQMRCLTDTSILALRDTAARLGGKLVSAPDVL